jgi:hypothetical protein
VVILLALIFEVPQVIESEYISVTHAGHMLDFAFHVFGAPDIVALPGLELLHWVFSVHVEVHLILKHDVDLVFELGDASHVVFHL